MSSKGMKNVVILYGTHFGSTEEVALKIRENLKESRVNTSVYNLKEIIDDKQFDLEDYNGIILGTSIHACHWTKSARKFLKAYSRKIKERNRPFGVFILCGEASDPSKIKELRKRWVEDVLSKYSIKSQIYDVFGGVMDLTEESRMGKFEQKIIKLMSKTDPNIKVGQKNDFRDWNRIRSFSENFIEIL